VRLRHFIIAFKVLVGASLVYLLVRDAAAEDVWSVLAQTRFSLIFLAVVVFAAAVALNAIRWRIVLDLLGTRLPVRTAVVGTFEGMFFNLFLPTGVGGDVVRAYRAYDHGLTARRAAEGALIDRALGLWGLALAVVAAAPFSLTLQQVPAWRLLVGFAAVVILGGLAVAYAAKLLAPNAGAGWIAGALSLVGDYGRVVRAPLFWKAIVPMLALSNLLIGLSAWIVAQGIGLAAGFADMVIVIEGGALTAMIPISIGGWGVREGTIAFLIQAMGYPQAAALAISALMGLILAVIGLAGAAIWIASPYNRAFRLAGRGKSTHAEPDEQPDPGASN
jgi:hypothetical protein